MTQVNEKILLEIENLSVAFGKGNRKFKAVSGVNLTVHEGEVVGIVGESGSGKSVSMMALMGLLDKQSEVTANHMRYQGMEMQHMSPAQKRKIIGKDIAMIFQDPMTSLNPSYTVGHQIMEVLSLHQGLRGSALRDRTIELLQMVEIPSPESRLNQYPHQMSGGMCQRIVIAMAIACNPKLLIADEPTTALDVTIQAQIMKLLVRLQKQHNMALILITHDLAVVAEIAQRSVVMYSGEVIEVSPVPVIFRQPVHPYTQALLNAIPEHSKGASRLSSLPGIVPGNYDRPAGCLLSPRCPNVQQKCIDTHPELTSCQGQNNSGEKRQVRCFYPLMTQSDVSA